MFSLYMHIHLDKLDATGFASHVMVYCKYISVLLSIQSLLVPCKTLISKARHCLMPFLFKGHASINQSIATPHALLFKVVLQLCTSTYSSHANLFFTRIDKENRLTTQDTQSQRSSYLNKRDISLQVFTGRLKLACSYAVNNQADRQ